MNRIELAQRSKEWYAWRQNAVGSSDIACIIGQGFKSRDNLLLEKLGLKETYVNKAMKGGIKYEEEALNFINKKYKKNFSPVCCFSENPRFIASLDGYDENTDEILEIKVPYVNSEDSEDLEKVSEKVSDDIPVKYFIQMQWQMFVSNTKKGMYVEYFPNTVEKILYTTEVTRDDEYIEYLIMQAYEFLHALDTKNISEIKINSFKNVSSDHSYFFYNISYYKKVIKEAQEKLDAEIESLKSIYGHDTSLKYGDFELNRFERTNIDYKKAATEHCKNLDAYKKETSVGWTFRVKKEN